MYEIFNTIITIKFNVMRIYIASIYDFLSHQNEMHDVYNW
jgi:hypothetical protein